MGHVYPSIWSSNLLARTRTQGSDLQISSVAMTNLMTAILTGAVVLARYIFDSVISDAKWASHFLLTYGEIQQ